MALRRVDLSTDVYFVCLNHAMCTEGEEIVGLLVGEVDEERVAHVSAVLILRRSDKRKDRVEISPEQLSNASTEAERLACILKRPVRVVGWYHSHPKLTVYPSLVDVCTQESYQLMDEGFIGMIFSVFNTDPNKFGGRIQMICYQSQTIIIDCNVEKSHVEIPIQLVPSTNISDVCMNTVIQLPRFLCQEEQLAYQMANQVPLDYLTRLHNSSVYLRKLGQIAEVICGPLLKMLEERILNNEMRRKGLQEKKKALTAILEKTRIEKARKEKEKEEKAKRECELLEIAKKKQIEQQELEELEEQEMRAALLKDQEMRAQNRDVLIQNLENIIEVQEIQVETSVEQETQNELCDNEKTPGTTQLDDQEVPQLKEQNKYVGNVKGMQQLEGPEWDAELEAQKWQEAQLQGQENQEAAVIETLLAVQAQVEMQENIRSTVLGTDLKDQKRQGHSVKEHTIAAVEIQLIQNKDQPTEQEKEVLLPKENITPKESDVKGKMSTKLQFERKRIAVTKECKISSPPTACMSVVSPTTQKSPGPNSPS